MMDQINRLVRGVLVLSVVLLPCHGVLAEQTVVTAPEGTSLAADLTITEMAGESQLIVLGRCTSVESFWLTPRLLATRATVEVSETLKGRGTSEVSIVLPGGADANRKFPIAMTYPGAPSLRIGENVFLFLVPDDALDGAYVISGFAQGKFSIVEDEDGRQLVSRDLTGLRLKRGSGVTRGTVQLTPLDEFKGKVRAALP